LRLHPTNFTVTTIRNERPCCDATAANDPCAPRVRCSLRQVTAARNVCAGNRRNSRLHAGGIIPSPYWWRESGFFILFIAPLAGMIVAEAVRLVTRRRRGRWLPLAAAGATLVGGLLIPVYTAIFSFLASFTTRGGSLLGLLWPAVFAILCASTVYYRLKGIRL
jgi:hypothetical protein